MRENIIQPSGRGRDEHPLSFLQERLWLLNQKFPRDLSYNIPFAFTIAGALDVAALRQSLSEVVQRHQTLRAHFTRTPRGEPAQIIGPDGPFDLPTVDAQESELPRYVKDNSRHVFDLATGPLVVAKLLRLTATKHVLLLNIHHIAADGWSVEKVLFSELQRCYAAFAERRTPDLPPLSIQYTDFAYWQRAQDLSHQLAYWQGQLAGYEDALELPADFPRTPHAGRVSESFVHRYGRDFSRDLDRLAQSHGATLFMVLVAGFSVAVSRYTGREDLCIGTTTAGRVLPELEPLVGFFVNILPLRIKVDEDATVEDHVRGVRAQALAAFDHQMVPFERILDSVDLDRRGRAYPLVPLVLRHQNFPRTSMKADLPGGVRFDAYCDNAVDLAASGEDAMARAELELSYTGDKDDLKVEVMFAPDLYRRETVERLLAHHEQILREMAGDRHQRLSALVLTTEHDARVEGAPEERPHPSAAQRFTFVQRWDSQVARSPDAVATYDASGTSTFREVAAQVDRLARALVARGVLPGDVVGVCLDRGAPLIVALFAVWKAGAAYVPMDPSYPSTYLTQILGNAEPKFVVCTNAYRTHLGLPEARCVLIDAWPSVPDVAASKAPLSPAPGDLAYIMYTSGSTGVPKGVRIPHLQLTNWLEGIEAQWPFASDDIVAQKTSIGFAVSAKELFAGLLNGRPLVFLDPATVQDPAAFVAALTRHRVTRLNLVPSHFDAVLTHIEKTRAGLPYLRLCVVAGEPLPAELVLRARACLPALRLLNNYGCTELNDITYYDTSAFDGSNEFVPVGHPIQNTQIYVLDRRGRLVPEGVAGEIHVASDSMALGYHNLPSLTKERFRPNPFSDDPARILYNTGDVAKYLPDGTLEYIGRWDFQVKVRGFRVDVRHVEKILAEFPGMDHPVVVGDGRQLFAFYVAAAKSAPGSTLDVEALRAYLQARLPSYMVPSGFVAMEALPRLPNGKLNRRALTPAAGRLAQSDAYEAPATKTEAILASIWSGVLDIPEDVIGRKTNFFEIGGHSLAAVRVIARIRERFSVEIPVSWLFERPRLQDLGAHLEGAVSPDAEDDEAGTTTHRDGTPRESERRVDGLLEGKVVLMTGSHQGIVGAAARLLAGQGASVALGYLYDEARATKLKAMIEGAGGVAETYHADLVDGGDVTRMVAQVLERFGRIDVLVANATAEFKVAPFVDQAWSRFERTVVDELKAVFHACQAVVPGMAQRKSGSIVVLSSAMTRRPEAGYVTHAVAKAALDAFVRSLAVELGPDGVRVNTVAPGLTLTEATESLPLHVKDAAIARCPLRRNGLPRDVAGAVLFLASDLSQFMTGAYLPVDGGTTMP